MYFVNVIYSGIVQTFLQLFFNVLNDFNTTKMFKFYI